MRGGVIQALALDSKPQRSSRAASRACCVGCLAKVRGDAHGIMLTDSAEYVDHPIGLMLCKAVEVCMHEINVSQAEHNTMMNKGFEMSTPCCTTTMIKPTGKDTARSTPALSAMSNHS